MGAGIHVPFREIALSGGEPPLRVYDRAARRVTMCESGFPRSEESG